MHSTARALVVTVTKDVREEGNDPSAGRRARSSAEGLNLNAVVVHRVLQSEAAVDRTVTIGGRLWALLQLLPPLREVSSVAMLLPSLGVVQETTWHIQSAPTALPMPSKILPSPCNNHAGVDRERLPSHESLSEDNFVPKALLQCAPPQHQGFHTIIEKIR